MSRVYEAMQRAAAENSEKLVPAGIVLTDVDFPAEEPAAPTEVPAAPAHGATPANGAVVAAQATVPAPAPTAPAPVTSAPAVSSPAVSTPEVPAPAVSASAPVVSAPAPPAPPAPADAPSTLQPTTFDRTATRYEGKTVLNADLSPQSREQYRRLAATLHRAQQMHGTKVIMVTSALVGEGKTLTASNIALTLSQSYQKQVLLVDADLRRPSLQAVFGIRASRGLAENLTTEHHQPVAVHQVTTRLGILTAGRPTSDPIAALTSQRMHHLIEEARHTFDWVILDTPPVAMLTDANLVSAMTDGAVIVIKAGSTPWTLVDRAVQAVGRERTLGIVLNQARTSGQDPDYYGAYYYGPPPEEK